MSRIKAFEGLRPVRELAHKVACPPYDVIDSEEARRMAEGNEISFLHVVKPEIDLPPGTDLYDPRVYETGASNLARLIERGVLRQDPEPRLYLYSQKMGAHEQHGLVCCASVEEYENGLILKHELTRADKEDDRTRHVDTLDANTGPVFLTYRAREELDALTRRCLETIEPEYDFEDENGVRHTFRGIRDGELVKAFVEAFSKIDKLYIADGHHRAASAARVKKQRERSNPGHTGEEEYNFFLTVIFPHDQMNIIDYNRVVRDLNGLDENEFLAKVEESFTVRRAEGRVKPSRPHTFGMYLKGAWYELEAREGTYDPDDPVDRLDVSILQRRLLSPILGIENPRKDERISFVGGIRGLSELEKLVDEKGYAVAFAMYPTTIDDLMSIADAGKIMPPKSTWFEPKLRSGLIVHLLGDKYSPRRFEE